jgi:hypothetical protein
MGALLVLKGFPIELWEEKREEIKKKSFSKIRFILILERIKF